MHKKVIAALLGVTLALLCMPGVPAVYAENTDIRLTVCATNVKGVAPTLELGVKVSTGAELFKSAGLVLALDNRVLAPIHWENNMEYDLRRATDWESAVPVGTKNVDEYMGGTAQAYTEGTTTYLYLSGEAVNGEAVSEKQIVTVRLGYREGKSMEDVQSGTIALAPDQVAYGSPAQHSVLYHNDTDFYYYNPLTKDSDGNVVKDTGVQAGSLLNAPVFEAVQNGPSVVPAAGGVPVIFYDWDETLLGSIVVAAGEDMQAAVEEFETGLKATEEQLAGTLWYDQSDLPLTYKKGYSFGKWIPYDAKDQAGNEVYTSYGAVVNVKNATMMAEALPVPADAGITGQEESILLKAAYGANRDMDQLQTAGPSKWNYTVKPVAYMQFGNSANYSVTVNIRRENEDENGVYRVRKLGLRVGMTVEGAAGTVYALQELKNSDSVNATVAVNDQVQMVSFEVVDLCDVITLGGTTNWAGGAAARSAQCSAVPGTGHGDQAGFLNLGVVGYINDQLRSAAALGDTVDAIGNGEATQSGIFMATGQYTAAELDTASVAGTSGSAVVRRRWALANMYRMFLSVPAEKQAKGLNWDELQEAVVNGTVWDPDRGGWTNGFNGTYQGKVI